MNEIRESILNIRQLTAELREIPTTRKQQDAIVNRCFGIECALVVIERQLGSKRLRSIEQRLNALEDTVNGDCERGADYLLAELERAAGMLAKKAPAKKKARR